MGRPKQADDPQRNATSRAAETPQPAVSPAPVYPSEPPVQQKSPVGEGGPYQQRSPHVQMAVSPGYGAGPNYPPTPPVFNPSALNQPIGAPWSSGIFDCNKDDNNAVVTAFFPCVTYGQIAEILDEGQTTCTVGSVLYLLLAPALCSCWILGSGNRAKLRSRYNLVQAPAEDWVVHLFFPCCSLCQEFRELKNRGIDPSLGYWGNLALAQQNTATQPPTAQHMTM